jgi:hypothetical protein
MDRFFQHQHLADTITHQEANSPPPEYVALSEKDLVRLDCEMDDLTKEYAEGIPQGYVSKYSLYLGPLS